MTKVQDVIPIIINSFIPDSYNCIALDTDDNVVYVGTARLIDFGVNDATELVGKKLYEIIHISSPIDEQSYLHDVAKIKADILGSHKIITVLVSAKFNHTPILHLTQIRSICDENKRIIGCVIHAKDFTLSTNKAAKSIKLSSYQEEIMFLLGLGFSQKEIADIYAVKRGTIVKMIGFICNKFGINGASSDRLIELIYNQGYGIPPYSLLKTGIFPVSATFITKDMFKQLLK